MPEVAYTVRKRLDFRSNYGEVNDMLRIEVGATVFVENDSVRIPLANNVSLHRSLAPRIIREFLAISDSRITEEELFEKKPEHKLIKRKPKHLNRLAFISKDN